MCIARMRTWRQFRVFLEKQQIADALPSASCYHSKGYFSVAVNMAQPIPPRVLTNNPTETSINTWWQPGPAGDARMFRLQYREFPKPWAEAKTVDLPLQTKEHVVNGLNPTATYEFRLRYLLPDGTETEPGQAGTADTLPVGCTPKKKKGESSCAVQ
jgi:hypothetical protein